MYVSSTSGEHRVLYARKLSKYANALTIPAGEKCSHQQETPDFIQTAGSQRIGNPGQTNSLSPSHGIQLDNTNLPSADIRWVLNRRIAFVPSCSVFQCNTHLRTALTRAFEFPCLIKSSAGNSAVCANCFRNGIIISRSKY